MARPSLRRTATPRIVFALGVPFCGSTALGNMLNALRPGLYPGELERTPQNLPFYNGPAKLVRCHICRDATVPCPVWPEQRVSDLGLLSVPELYASLLASAQSDVLVDGSKSPGYLQRVAPQLTPHADLRALILVRDPVHSMSTYIASRLRRGHETPAWQAANFWRDTYAHALTLVASLGIPSLIFATGLLRDTRPTELEANTRPLRRFLGIDGIDMPTRPADVEALFAPSHQLGGNPNVQRPGAVERRVASSAEVRAERFDELADAFLQSPSAPELAKMLGLSIRHVVSDRPA